MNKTFIRFLACLLFAGGMAQADSERIINPSNGHAYQRIDAALTWSDAKLHCENLGGYLATLTSQDENDFVYDNLVIPFVTENYWLGGTDEVVEGGWQWITGETWSYSNWAAPQEGHPGEPDDAHGGQDYLIFWADSPGAWGDAGCPGTCWYEFAFICEWDNQGYIDVTSLPDINYNGSPELAALRALPGGSSEVIITDSDTDEEINVISFAASEKVPTGITGLLDINGNGSPEVAVLLVKSSGTGVVAILDSETGAYLDAITFFGKKWQAKGITSQDLNDDGVSEISVLAEKDDGTAVKIQIRDSMTGDEMNWINLPVE